MLSDSQVRYLEEVLGTSVNYFQATEAPVAIDSPAVKTHATLVLTLGLGPEEETLLQKILASVQLSDFHHEQVTAAQIGNFPELMHAPHVLAFFSAGPDGRIAREDSVWWNLPTLSEMLGNQPGVVEKKRTTWTVLQRFAKERTR